MPDVAYNTDLGVMLVGRAEDALTSPNVHERGHAQLVFSSPPFALQRKKAYGNLTGDEYVAWLASFAPLIRDTLAPDGSIVLELGNAWEPGLPVMSTVAIEALLAFGRAGGFHVCQQFVWENPARLPSPAQWVTVERTRVKDSFTHVWWFSPSERPKADNRRVLVPYSPSMRRLLDRGTYNSGPRPSGHVIGKESFLTDNGGAIPSNVIRIANTRSSNDRYLAYCRERDIIPHPARMPVELAEFFIRFLTDPGDLVLDPFAGSNTTGAAAEGLNRRWIGIEENPDYANASEGHFIGPTPKQTVPGQLSLTETVPGQLSLTETLP